MASKAPAPTVYKPVTYVGKGGGTLRLLENELNFQMYDPTAANNVKIYTLPWSKIQKRQVSTSDQSQAKIKLILRSGTEAIFQMDDRIGLEVLRDDIGERLLWYKAQHPDSDDEQAVNQTRSAQSARRQSTPYRMAKPPAPAPTAKPREPQPYRMAAPAAATTAMPRRHSQPPVSESRQPQPYRMKQKEPPTGPRPSQPYRYVAKK
jgi:hypothetical protein